MHVLLLALTQLWTLATTEHVVYNGTTQEGGGDQQTRTLLDEIDTEVRGVVRDMILPRIRPNSCSEIAELHPGLPSGYYVINHDGTAVEVFCDMDRVCGCNITGGWTHIANLNINDLSQRCQVNGPCKLAAQNQGGYVGEAAVVRDVSQLRTAPITE